MSTYNMIIIMQCISILVLWVGSIYLFCKWKGKEHSYLVIFCISTLVNNIGSLIEIMAHNSQEALLGVKFAYVGKVFIPLTFFLFILQYCEISLSPKIKIVLAYFHMSIALLVFTFPAHKLFYTSIRYTEEGLFPHNVFGHGIMYNVYTICLVGYFIAVFSVIVYVLKKEKRKKRRVQMYYMLACAVCAILGFVIFLSGITRGYDTTSISYMICTIFMAIALARYDLLDTLELVRNYVTDNLSLGITALDEDNRIIYYNRPLKEIYPDFKKNGYGIVGKLIQACESKQVVMIGDKVYQPEYKELYRDDKYRGHIITLSDITDSYHYTRLMKKMTETDSLTGLYNRFAYEYRISELKKSNLSPSNLIVFAMDINGLKTVNDTLGHEMGDALISDAADCICGVIKEYGDCYRMGGDEFAAIITDERADPDKIKKKIEQRAKQYQSEHYEVSISIGYASGREHPGMNIVRLGKLADERMYQVKEDYYITRGIDRRAQNAAFTEICDSYLKILKVNLTTESFEIIKMSIEEKNSNTGFARKISIWLHDFAISGMVHPDDRQEYLSKTNIEYLRNHFQTEKSSVKLRYRRRVGDTFHKVMMEMIPEKKDSKEEQVVFLYVKDIE